ncbi:hypothetical protein [Streptomyces sp. NPDC056105]|uniref:hypothetical protein n=1 Tax=Streptomyces sp. NPDC056105 TaxID=3345714 RepID=UPI0035E3407D
MPDTAMAKRWDLALEHLANSVTACTEGSISEDQASFDLMASEMDIGIKHLNAVNKHLDEVVASQASFAYAHAGTRAARFIASDCARSASARKPNGCRVV